MTDMQIWESTVDRVGGVVTVTVGGELDLLCTDELRAKLLEEIDQPGTELLAVDMAGVTFLDSTSISTLVTAYEAARRDGVGFRVVRPSPRVVRVLQVTGISDLFCRA